MKISRESLSVDILIRRHDKIDPSISDTVEETTLYPLHKHNSGCRNKEGA